MTISRTPQSRNPFAQLAGDNYTISTESLVSDDAVSKRTVMKRSVVISAAVGVLLIGVCVVLFVPAREPLSLTLLNYRRWPHGATLRLTNNTTKTITYLTDWGAYTPVLFRQKTGNGWSTSAQVMSQLRVGFSTQS